MQTNKTPSWNERRKLAATLLKNALEARDLNLSGNARNMFDTAKFEIRCGMKGV